MQITVVAVRRDSSTQLTLAIDLVRGVGVPVDRRLFGVGFALVYTPKLATAGCTGKETIPPQLLADAFIEVGDTLVRGNLTVRLTCDIDEGKDLDIVAQLFRSATPIGLAESSRWTPNPSGDGYRKV